MQEGAQGEEGRGASGITVHGGEDPCHYRGGAAARPSQDTTFSLLLCTAGPPARKGDREERKRDRERERVEEEEGEREG